MKELNTKFEELIALFSYCSWIFLFKNFRLATVTVLIKSLIPYP